MKLCRRKCEKTMECGGYTFTGTKECWIHGWSDDLKEVESIQGDTSGMCDHYTVEEFSLIGCYVAGAANEGGGAQFLRSGLTMSGDLLERCKKYCKHTCYMGIGDNKCFCSDDPQLDSPFYQLSDSRCANKDGNKPCSVKYGCGGTKFNSVYSNNNLKFSKCSGKTVWGKTCTYEIRKSANGFTYKTMRTMSAVLCQQACEKDRKCGCYMYMPGTCHLQAKGVSCVVEKYDSTCAFTAGTCRIKAEDGMDIAKSENFFGESEMANFGAMGGVKIQNADGGGYMSVSNTATKGSKIVVSGCKVNSAYKCEWKFQMADMSWKRSAQWNIMIDVGKTYHMDASPGAVRGLAEKTAVSLKDSKGVYEWILEPSPHRDNHYYIRRWRGNTYMKKITGDKVNMDACESTLTDVPACQWTLTGLPLPKIPDDVIDVKNRFMIQHGGSSEAWLHTNGGNKKGNVVNVWPCALRGDKWNHPSCYWYFVKSRASTKNLPVWYMKASNANLYVTNDNGKAKLGACNGNLGANGPSWLFGSKECQWIVERNGKDEYTIRSMVGNVYLQSAEKKGSAVTVGQCSGSDEKKCKWKFTGSWIARVDFDLMGHVAIKNANKLTEQLASDGKFEVTNGKYKHNKNTQVLYGCQDLRKAHVKKYPTEQWRCHWVFEKSGLKAGDLDVWYIRNWRGFDEKGPEAYLFAPEEAQVENGKTKVDTCAVADGERPKACQWTFEAVNNGGYMQQVDVTFRVQNVAVSEKSKDLYMKPGASKIQFMKCRNDNKCNWRVVPSKGYEGRCMSGATKMFPGTHMAGANDMGKFHGVTVEECNRRCYGVGRCVGFTYALNGKCVLKQSNMPMAPKKGQNSYILTGSHPVCTSPAMSSKSGAIAKEGVMDMFDFRLTGCALNPPAPSDVKGNLKHEVGMYSYALFVGRCMEHCRGSCVMILHGNGICECSKGQPSSTSVALGKCSKCLPSCGYYACGAEVGKDKYASVYTNMHIREMQKCEGVYRPPVTAAEKGTKHCAVHMGMKVESADASKTNGEKCREECSKKSTCTRGYIFDGSGKDFGCGQLEWGTAEECAKKCEDERDCAGYTFDQAGKEGKEWKCALLNWGFAMVPTRGAKFQATGTCDEKPVEKFSFLGCYAAADWLVEAPRIARMVKDNTRGPKCAEMCGEMCYFAMGVDTCVCGDEIGNLKKKTGCNINCGTAGGCGDSGNKLRSVYTNNVLRSWKCSSKKPWRRLCTKKNSINVVGEDLASGKIADTTAGGCHQKCEEETKCGCFQWDPVKKECHLKKKKEDVTSAGSIQQCSEELHEGMFQLVGGTCE